MITWAVRIGSGVAIGLMLFNGLTSGEGRAIGAVLLAVAVYEGVIHLPPGGGGSGPFRPA